MVVSFQRGKIFQFLLYFSRYVVKIFARELNIPKSIRGFFLMVD